MSGGLRVNLEGSKKLHKGIQQAISDLAYMEASEKAADMIIAQARNVAPVRTGELRDSLYAIGGVMGSDVVYSNPIHWGWARRNIKPNPFLLETARRLEPQWLGLFQDEVMKALMRMSSGR